MAQTFNKLKIDIKENVNELVTAKQNDSNSRFLDVYLYDGGVPIDLTGHDVRIYMLKSDGTEIFNNGEITEAQSGRCQFELTDQALGAIGKLQVEISIWKDNVQILTTPTFDIQVVKSLRSNGSVESSNEYDALVILYQELYEFRDLLAEAVASFTLEGITDLIGAAADTGGSKTAGTVMAKLNALLTSWTSTRAGYLDTIKNNTATNNTASKTGVLSAKLAYIIAALESTTLLSGKIIKSIQRGTIASYFDDDLGYYAKTVKKTISAVDMNKTMVNILTLPYGGGGNNGLNESVYLSLTSSTEITLSIENSNNNQQSVAYEIIEFY